MSSAELPEYIFSIYGVRVCGGGTARQYHVVHDIWNNLRCHVIMETCVMLCWGCDVMPSVK